MKNALTADETTTRQLDFYAGKLNGLGYNHIAHSRRVMKNSTGVGLYRLILTGRHERAVDRYNPSGLHLLEPDFGGEKELVDLTGIEPVTS